MQPVRVDIIITTGEVAVTRSSTLGPCGGARKRSGGTRWFVPDGDRLACEVEELAAAIAGDAERAVADWLDGRREP